MAEGTVQLPADGVGSKLRTKTRTISAATVHEQQFTVASDDTWYVWSGSLACAANKYFLSMFNAGAQVFRVQGLYLVNTTAAAVTGIAVQFDIKRITALTVGTGTTLTAQAMDSADTAIASCTLGATAQTVTDGAVLYSYWTNNDEIGATNAFTNVLQNGMNLIPDLPGTKKPTLRVNEGLTVKQITSSAIGTFGVLAVITKDP